MADHVRKARLEKHLSQHDAAKFFGMHYVSYNRWETNTTVVPIAYMPRVIDFIGHNPMIQNPKTLAEKFKKYRIENGYTFRNVSDISGIDRDTLRRVENGKKKLKEKTISRINRLISS